MCKTIDVQKKKKKNLYWDLINSNVNNRDVQTVVQGMYTKQQYRWWEYKFYS